MLQRSDQNSGSVHHAHLYLAGSPEDSWGQIILPWFKRVLPDSWRHKSPSVVLVPTRGQANDLKARLIEQRLSHLGLQILTPASLDALLARDDVTAPSRPENLRLLLAIAASEMELRPDESEALAAKAVARSPTSLLRSLRSLDVAGWKFEDLALLSFAPIVQRFNALLKQCDFVLPGEADRRLLGQAQHGNGKRFCHLLVTGFDGAHWPQWFLLRAAVELAEDATIIIEQPQENLSDVDLCWIGSWEEICGEAKYISKAAPLLGDSLFTEAEMRGRASQPAATDFIVGTNISEQADAIAKQCIRYLASGKCRRLGVIFPSAGALARLVSNTLARLDIPHNDGIAHFAPGIFESAEWLAWIELQRSPRLNSFFRFLNALPDPPVMSPNISRSVFEKILCASYYEILLDDLDVLREFCARGSDKSRAVAEALRSLTLLHDRSTLSGFLEKTQSALTQLGWKEHALEIASVTHDWPERVDVEFPRALFLRWLEEIGVTFRPERAAAGNNPYARVHLLGVNQAQNQDWSHLILCGLNEGAWPAAIGADFARPEQIRVFNQSAQQLNKRAARQGSQGEGHVSVSAGHSLYLGPIEQRGIALRQFDALVESPTEAITLAASLVQEAAPERPWNPSECLTRLFFTNRHQPLTQVTLKALRRPTMLPRRSVPATAGVHPTLVAFNARRDSLTPAGEYDFALRPNASDRSAPIVSVSDLEQMVASPAIIWIKRYLGAEADDDMMNPWAAVGGKWVHHWLAGIAQASNGKLFVKFPEPSAIDERVCSNASERRAEVHQLCASLGKTVPDWWTSGWWNALYLARHLGSKIARVTDWKWMATELPIGRDGPIQIFESLKLHFRGQIDLVLAQNDSSSFEGQNIWIIDYKTNSTRELRPTDLHDSLVKGTTLQLGLYSLAIQALGAAGVNASIVSRAVKAVAPQLSAADLAAHSNVFADLAEMQRTGIFGMKGEIRPAFGYSSPYPLATLQVDPDILEDKWALTHPALVLEKEEWEIW